MSIARVTAPAPIRAPRPRLRAVASPVRSNAAAPSQTRRVIRIVVIGAAIIQGISLLLSIGLSQSVYQLSHLKNERDALSVQSQLLAEQVDSLSSQQNLANSAASLGMIANANPVFLRISDAKVFGKPAAAIDTTGRVAKNNLANASMTDSSVLNLQSGASAASTAQSATSPATTLATGNSYVAPQLASSAKVALPSGVIPASPTH